MGTANFSFDHISGVLAMGLALFSPVAVLVWMAIERCIRPDDDGVIPSQQKSDNARS